MLYKLTIIAELIDEKADPEELYPGDWFKLFVYDDAEEHHKIVECKIEKIDDEDNN